MSVKHVKAYYEEICEQYHEMIENLRDFEKECEQNIVSPERLDQLKQMIVPLKTNYERISYIIFLLNQPDKKEKQKKYQRQNAKLLKAIDKMNTLNGVKAENNTVLNNMKEV